MTTSTSVKCGIDFNGVMNPVEYVISSIAEDDLEPIIDIFFHHVEFSFTAYSDKTCSYFVRMSGISKAGAS
jgi:hypothetical protein